MQSEEGGKGGAGEAACVKIPSEKATVLVPLCFKTLTTSESIKIDRYQGGRGKGGGGTLTRGGGGGPGLVSLRGKQEEVPVEFGSRDAGDSKGVSGGDVEGRRREANRERGEPAG